jgi:predicted nucleic acid-binding protein
MSESEPPPERDAICDTVVVNYFLAVGEFDLLKTVLGNVQVPRAVFDPEEPEDIADEAASELRQGLRLHRRRSTDDGLAPELRARSVLALPQFERLPQLCEAGGLVVLQMSSNELTTYAQLRSRDYVKQFSLIEGLGRGEAAALAIATTRSLAIATDDQDAIKVLSGLAPHLRVRRIRGLLMEAVERRLVAPTRAQTIHAAMKQAGFWDRGTL